MAEETAERVSEQLTAKLLKLPQEPEYTDIKRSMRYSMKADKAEDKEEALKQYAVAEGHIQTLINEGDTLQELKGLMGIVKKRIAFLNASGVRASVPSGSPSPTTARRGRGGRRGGRGRRGRGGRSSRGRRGSQASSTEMDPKKKMEEERIEKMKARAAMQAAAPSMDEEPNLRKKLLKQRSEAALGGDGSEDSEEEESPMESGPNAIRRSVSEMSLKGASEKKKKSGHKRSLSKSLKKKTEKLKGKKGSSQLSGSTSSTSLDVEAQGLPKSMSMTAIAMKSSSSGSDPGDGAKKKKKKKPSGKLSNTQVKDIYDTALMCIFLPINNEVMYNPQKLLETLRQALRISEKQHDTLINQVLEYCNFECVLAQLQSQLQQAHDHSFYQPSCFSNARDHNDWLSGEKRRIQALIEKVEQEHPGTRANDSYGWQQPQSGYHAIYQILARTLLDYECRKGIERKALAGDQLPSLVSEPSTWLISEYGDRYGVNTLYREISNLELLLVPFHRDYDSILMLSNTMDTVLRLIRNGEPITNKERDILSHHIDILTKQLKEDLCNFFTRYEGSDNFHQAQVFLDLLPLLADFNDALGKDSTEPEAFVTIHVKIAVGNRYSDLLEDSIPNSVELAKGDVCADQLSNMCDTLVIELGNVTKFNELFKVYIDLTQVCCEEYCRKLHRDVESLLNSDLTKEKAGAVLKLCKKISEANLELEVVQGWRVLPTMQWFAPYVHKWLKGLSKDMAGFVEDLCLDEEWEEVDENSYFSFSVLELFNRVQGPLAVIRQQDYIDPAVVNQSGKPTFQAIYAEQVLGTALKVYCEGTFDSFVKAFPLLEEKLREHMRSLFDIGKKAPTTTKLVICSKQVSEEEAEEAGEQEAKSDGKSPRKLFSKKSSSKYRSEWKKEVDMSLGEVDITGPMCVRVNDLRYCYLELHEIQRKHKGLKMDFKGLQAGIHNIWDHMVMMIVFWINNKMFMEVEYFSKKKKDVGTALMTFLDQQMAELNRHLDPEIFNTQLLPALWQSVMQNFKELLLRPKKKPSASTMKKCVALLENLSNYFHAGGQGIPRSTLEKDSNELIDSLNELRPTKSKKEKDKKEKKKKEKEEKKEKKEKKAEEKADKKDKKEKKDKKK